MLLSIYIDLCLVEKTKINIKEAEIGPFKKQLAVILKRLVVIILRVFLKNGPNPASFLFIFVLFT